MGLRCAHGLQSSRPEASDWCWPGYQFLGDAVTSFSQFGQNSAYVEELFRLYTADRALVGEEWAKFFDQIGQDESNLEANGNPNGNNGHAHGVILDGEPYIGGASDASTIELQALASITIELFRTHGHLLAKINPLSQGVSALPSPTELIDRRDKLLACGSALKVVTDFDGGGLVSVGDLLERLEETYCSTVGFEYQHLVSAIERAWLRERIERRFRSRDWFTVSERRDFYRALFDAERLETELHKKYVGAKRFSIQGGETLLPMVQRIVDYGAELGVNNVVIGMAHRGRLVLLTFVAGKPLHELFAEFEDSAVASVLGSGDVKYHLGAASERITSSGKRVGITLACNPSHLECVNPVVAGMVRALQDSHPGQPAFETLPLVIHGDAAMIGQGVVPETFNLAQTRAYRTGGTVHIIINNQVGFTTDAAEGRSSPYSSDIAKGLGVPVFHVNSEDIEACCWATQLALEFRLEFGRDAIVDLYCYRKYGHNEGDDPTFTQPLMYAEIKGKQPLFEIYGHALRENGVIEDATLQEIREESATWLVAGRQEKAQDRIGDACAVHGKLRGPAQKTAVELARLSRIAKQLITFPDGFNVHAKLNGILEKRVQTLQDGAGVDWGFAEALAFGSLLFDGISVRMSGQDCGRGTFSHRHLELHDVAREERYYPLQTLTQEEGLTTTFEVYNSTLSEMAVMGFEFGYAAQRSDSLVLWEAQFGDFANGAQIIIDQFISSSEAKWGQRSGLVLLLPHGYEGQGPEHSSARLERYLQLCAEGNICVCMPSTAAQHFHLLRRQGLSVVKRPLIVMTPKSLLRAPDAMSTAKELTQGAFSPLLVRKFGNQKKTGRLVVCSGKIYYDLVSALQNAKQEGVTVVRVEQLFPLEGSALKAASGGATEPALWVQEEPKNMGAWSYIEPLITEALGVRPVYVGRPPAASTACGSASWHAKEQQRIVDECLALVKGQAVKG